MNVGDPDHSLLSSLVVLYVEDDPAARAETAQFLSRRCGRLVQAGDGREGLREFVAQQPDLVVTNLQMPGMDGLEMASAIRRRGSWVPIIAVTGFDTSDWLLRAFEAGVDQYVLKPVQAPKLLQALLACAARLRSQHGPRRGAAKGSAPERRLRERTARLEDADRELAALCYSISHDLRAPLRAIDGFSQILAEDYSAHLDAEGLRFLGRIRSGAQHMGRILEDLLRLSRINRVELELAPLDLSAQAQAILAELAGTGDPRVVQVEVAAGLKAEGDPRLVRTLLENLLGNAWKYTAGTAAARIEFGAGEQDGEPVFFVRDNGLGFDMAHSAKLFTPFQRLHPGQDDSGTGIGLAIAQRIVHRHGGRIWAEAEPGRGALFTFTLPDRHSGS